MAGRKTGRLGFLTGVLPWCHPPVSAPSPTRMTGVCHQACSVLVGPGLEPVAACVASHCAVTHTAELGRFKRYSFEEYLLESLNSSRDGHEQVPVTVRHDWPCSHILTGSRMSECLKTLMNFVKRVTPFRMVHCTDLG